MSKTETLQSPSDDVRPSISNPWSPDYWRDPVWPENTPAVSMDINLGKKYRHVSFDPERYNGLLDELGVDDSDKSKVDVILRDDRPIVEEGLLEGSTVVLGNYRPISKRNPRGKMQIGLLDEYEPGIGNSTLRHETQHFADDVSGQLERDRRELPLIKRVGHTVLGITPRKSKPEERAYTMQDNPRVRDKFDRIIKTYYR